MNEHVRPTDGIDLSALAFEVVESLHPVAHSHAISLRLNLADSENIILGDKDQIYEVIENLLGNAIKYSRHGMQIDITTHSNQTRDMAEYATERIHANSARLTIAAPELDADARYCVLRVRDYGAGIKRRHLPRLSERFYRVGGQKTGPSEGTGLGLAIVKHIINRHRGGFTVESALGTGSCFTIFLPVEVLHDQSKSVDAQSESVKSFH